MICAYIFFVNTWQKRPEIERFPVVFYAHFRLNFLLYSRVLIMYNKLRKLKIA